jgi:hypothetical protein
MKHERMTKAELGDAIDRLELELRDARGAHKSVVAAKRRLNEKYSVIIRRKPIARYRRTRKRIERCVTKITHKLGKMR